MKVPLLDLQPQYATLREEMLAAVTAVLDSQQFINGPAVKELEAQVAAYSGCRRAVGISSGTDALLCALMTPGQTASSGPVCLHALVGVVVRAVRACGANVVAGEISRAAHRARAVKAASGGSLRPTTSPSRPAGPARS